MVERSIGAAEMAMSFAKPEGTPSHAELDGWTSNLMGDVKRTREGGKQKTKGIHAAVIHSLLPLSRAAFPPLPHSADQEQTIPTIKIRSEGARARSTQRALRIARLHRCAIKRHNAFIHSLRHAVLIHRHDRSGVAAAVTGTHKQSLRYLLGNKLWWWGGVACVLTSS